MRGACQGRLFGARTYDSSFRIARGQLKPGLAAQCNSSVASIRDKTSEKRHVLSVETDPSVRAKYPNIRLKDFAAPLSISSRDLSTSLPAKLESPAPLKKEDFNGSIPVKERAKWLFRLGKGYLNLYKTGIKNIWYNWTELKKIYERIGGRNLNDVVKYGNYKTGDAQKGPILSRNDYQLALRTKHDLGKLLPFGLVFAICGEFTPIIILAVGSVVVPYTCRIPRQEQADWLRPTRTYPAYKREMKKLRSSGITDNRLWQQEFVEAYRLKANPFVRPIPVIGQFWHALYSGRQVRKHCEDMLCDTILIEREGGMNRLSTRELFLWSLRYGLPELRQCLGKLQAEKSPINPDAKHLRDGILPAAEKAANRILNRDWTQIKPEEHWLAVYETSKQAANG
jgi:hypothetical protein